MKKVAEALLGVLAARGRAALATVVRCSGSTPQAPGARLLLLQSGELVGTVGGGAVERAVTEDLWRCLTDAKPRLVEYDLGRDLGMCCGGRMEVFVEPIRGRERLIIFGAGHVAQPTAALAPRLGFSVTVVDDREELNTAERFPGAELILAEPAEARERLQPTQSDWLLIVTHDHRLDEEALDVYARLPHRYIGMIGSRRKVLRVLERIKQRAGLPDLSRVYTPVGLDIGAVTPDEIAVSIVAELTTLKHGHAAPHLRALDEPALAKVLERD